MGFGLRHGPLGSKQSTAICLTLMSKFPWLSYSKVRSSQTCKGVSTEGLRAGCDTSRMGLFTQKTDEQLAAEAARSAEKAFWASPQGRATTAFDRGDEFLQMEIPHFQ